jgi:hypothetical protein
VAEGAVATEAKGPRTKGPAMEAEARTDEPAVEAEAWADEPAVEAETRTDEPAVEAEDPWTEKPAMEAEARTDEPAVEAEDPWTEKPAVEAEARTEPAMEAERRPPEPTAKGPWSAEPGATEANPTSPGRWLILGPFETGVDAGRGGNLGRCRTRSGHGCSSDDDAESRDCCLDCTHRLLAFLSRLALPRQPGQSDRRPTRAPLRRFGDLRPHEFPSWIRRTSSPPGSLDSL